ncbi:cytochrome bd-I oxidase subunit CydX [Candidatus Methylospira mobilis]|uniref:Cytochrome bd-I oxidase subunit CydX n=1 Tax=Candidatus Methylospira mobilis TaxID=1808979 RepID=A0A5Q0BIY4_9GAMM|nr:cytochrome bd-I oxidase subunit CydX [Candidatus Methylospira mobilis]QFY41786.1 cytochrome bd-I oxidase subunit CydX [Candidatus Methylospira mobilis]WNV06650.1 cytochrome bd-I oxidase subunit CydX [Candidatus Methylospira mobilis]
MWYFTWILGVCFSASFAILNAMWLESACGGDAEGHGVGGDVQQVDN